MTTHKHTPEPWRMVRLAGPSSRPRIDDARGKVVAHIEPRPFAEQTANGLLLAASPALLAELEQGFEATSLPTTLRWLAGMADDEILANWLRAKAKSIETALRMAAGAEGGQT